jgi:hypothetical protein
LAAFATELVEVGVPVANDELVQVDLAVIAELYGQVGVLWIVVESKFVSDCLVLLGYHLLGVRHDYRAQYSIAAVLCGTRGIGGGV